MKSPIGLSADLPVLDITREALLLLWQKRVAVVRMFLPAMILLALVDWASSDLLGEDNQSARLIFVAVSLILGVLFATACHRFTLLPQEQWDANALHSFGRDEGRYLLRAIVIGVVAALVFFLIMLGLMLWAGQAQELVPLAAVAGALPALYIWARLSLTLPELALGRNSPLKRSWAMSEGNGSRLVLVVIILPVLMMLPFFALYTFDSAILNYLAAFGSYITSLISLVMLSLSYRFLLEFYEPPAAVDAQPEQARKESDQTTGFDA